jgi:ParB/Sulfiredoxin domain
MRCLEQPARLAQDHPVTHRNGYGDTPSHVPNFNLCLKVEMLPPEALKAYPANARTHSKKQIRQIAESIKRFGFCNPVLIDDGGQIIAGHGRLAAAGEEAAHRVLLPSRGFHDGSDRRTLRPPEERDDLGLLRVCATAAFAIRDATLRFNATPLLASRLGLGCFGTLVRDFGLARGGRLVVGLIGGDRLEAARQTPRPVGGADRKAVPPLRAAVRKKLGLTLVSEKVGDERVYRIVSPDATAAKKSSRRAA